MKPQQQAALWMLVGSCLQPNVSGQERTNLCRAASRRHAVGALEVVKGVSLSDYKPSFHCEPHLSVSVATPMLACAGPRLEGSGGGGVDGALSPKSAAQTPATPAAAVVDWDAALAQLQVGCYLHCQHSSTAHAPTC